MNVPNVTVKKNENSLAIKDAEEGGGEKRKTKYLINKIDWKINGFYKHTTNEMAILFLFRAN